MILNICEMLEQGKSCHSRCLVTLWITQGIQRGREMGLWKAETFGWKDREDCTGRTLIYAIDYGNPLILKWIQNIEPVRLFAMTGSSSPLKVYSSPRATFRFISSKNATMASHGIPMVDRE